MVHVGIGYDIHALVAGRKLILGGGVNQPLPSSSFEAIL
jgi:2C-methyl-D-erythritol 2,4-cyclodiphosphate synthase